MRPSWKLGDRLEVVDGSQADHNAVEMTVDGGVVLGSINVPAGTLVRVVEVRSSERTDVVVLDGELAGRRFRMLADRYLDHRDN